LQGCVTKTDDAGIFNNDKESQQGVWGVAIYRRAELEGCRQRAAQAIYDTPGCGIQAATGNVRL